jgi:hypothetical protein
MRALGFTLNQAVRQSQFSAVDDLGFDLNLVEEIALEMNATRIIELIKKMKKMKSLNQAETQLLQNEINLFDLEIFQISN